MEYKLPKTFFSMGSRELDPPKTISNSMNKPIGAFYSSPKPKDNYKTAWVEWCSGEGENMNGPMPEWERNYGIELTLKNNANILIITPDMVKEKNGPFDYIELSKMYDGVFVTQDAINERPRDYIDIPFFPGYDKCLMGSWDVETLALFNIDCIESYQYVNDIPELNEDIINYVLSENQYSQYIKDNIKEFITPEMSPDSLSTTLTAISAILSAPAFANIDINSPELKKEINKKIDRMNNFETKDINDTQLR